MISPVEANVSRPGVKAGASNDASAAAMVLPPTSALSHAIGIATSTHSPPKVPASRPALIQPAPRRSMAWRSRQAT
ncbi:hypothetical protein D3C81_1996450 [compost metagenome]